MVRTAGNGGSVESPWRDLLAAGRDAIRSHRLAVAVAVAAMAVHALATGAYAWLIGPLLAFLFTGTSSDMATVVGLVPGIDASAIERDTIAFALPAVILVVAAIKGVAYYQHVAGMGRVAERTSADIRRTLARALVGARDVELDGAMKGDLSARLLADVDTFSSGVSSATIAIVRDGATVLVLAALAVALDWQLALLAFVVFPAAMTPMVRFGRRLRRSTRDGQTASGALAAQAVESLHNRAALRTRAARASRVAAFDQEIERVREARSRAVATRALNHPIMEFLGVGGLAATLWYAGFRIWSGDLAPTHFVSFFAAVLMLYEPLKHISRASAAVHDAAAAWDRLAPVLALHRSDADRPLPRLGAALALHDVCLGYGDTVVLSVPNLRLACATTHVVSGPSGAGKTTLLAALTGARQPLSGRVTWDEEPLDASDADRLAERIAYLDQDAAVLGATVAENLRLDCPDASDDALHAALAAVSLESELAPRGGLAAPLQEDGADLSGGQRRRLALARALVRHRHQAVDDRGVDLVILDEPTDAVDPAAERAVLHALRELHRECTLVVVTHRPEALPWADSHWVVTPGTPGVLRPVVERPPLQASV